MISFLTGAALVFGGILVAQIAWNYGVSPLTGLPQANYPQTIGLLIFIWIAGFLARGFSGPGSTEE